MAQFASLSIVPLLLLCFLSVTATFSSENDENGKCHNKPCHPPTGNLLIGRKHQLRASSTCGAVIPQQYYIISDANSIKCFMCDSRRPPAAPALRIGNPQNRRIENVVPENRNANRQWWQSENGVEKVSIRLDLEAEFLFTKLSITFGPSPSPAALLIERSTDFGRSWSIYRYFAKDCALSFPNVPEEGAQKEPGEVICSRKYSDLANATGKELIFNLIPPNVAMPSYTSEMLKLSKITNLRINFTKLDTLAGDVLGVQLETDQKYWYSISELDVQGSCFCNGHAHRCVPIGIEMPGDMAKHSADIVHGICECKHNTKGPNCDQCQDLFNDAPWQPAIGEQPNECRPCQCNGQATRCHFDWAVFQSTGSVSGGVCDNCEQNTEGRHCDKRV